MAIIWYVQEGNSLNREKKRYDLPFAELVKLCDKFPGKYLGVTPPAFPSSNPVLDGFRDYEYVVLELTSEDLAGLPPNFGFRPKPKLGFYHVPITIQECEVLLQQHTI
jgi:hypothetical protein